MPCGFKLFHTLFCTLCHIFKIVCLKLNPKRKNQPSFPYDGDDVDDNDNIDDDDDS